MQQRSHVHGIVSTLRGRIHECPDFQPPFMDEVLGLAGGVQTVLTEGYRRRRYLHYTCRRAELSLQRA